MLETNYYCDTCKTPLVEETIKYAITGADKWGEERMFLVVLAPRSPKPLKKHFCSKKCLEKGFSSVVEDNGRVFYDET